MDDPKLQVDQEIARRLGRTWPAFFQRFGRLTGVQRAAIPVILDGESVLVSSATASGKTEAACAPLLERRLFRTSPSTVLYISPTRALVNDLYERISGPCDLLSLRPVRRTGEHKSSLKGAADVLLTTPESFDSLLCRGRTTNGHVLASVRAVVLDEIHLLDGTARGEQVRWLLERLRRVRIQAAKNGWADDSSLQVVALSATVANSEAVRDRYLPGGRCLTIPGQRDIEVVAPPETPGSIVAAICHHLSAEPQDRKVVIFCNERKQVDELVRQLRGALKAVDCRVHAHHGSLSQRIRELAEEELKSDRRVVVVATSTLEIGIDVGDIDLVVLDGPAPSVPALLQRIGRGNRRTGTTRLMAWSENDLEKLVHEAMLGAAKAGSLGDQETGPHFGVLRQQVASYIFQAPEKRRYRTSVDDLCGAMGLAYVGERIVSSMLLKSDLEKVAEKVGLGLELRNAAAKGDVHSTIEKSHGSSVVDAFGAGQIATDVKYLGGTHLGVGGQDLRVQRVRDRKVEVHRNSDASGGHGAWKYASGPWFFGAGQPRALRDQLLIPTGVWPCLTRRERHFVFHFGGSRRGALLSLLDGVEILDVNGWLFVTSEPIDRVQKQLRWGPDRAGLRQRVSEHLVRLERDLGRPFGNRDLPEEVRIDEVLGWLGVEEEIELWSSISIVPFGNEEVDRALGLLVDNLSAENRLR